MSINSINNYGMTGTNGVSGTNNSTGKNGTLSMNDFLQLLVAQLKNQDMYNTIDDAEYMAQMAQFSMLQAITDMSELSMTSYGVSLIGKEVTIAKIADDGTVDSFQGIVDSVNFYNGSPQAVVDDRSYPLSSVMSVREPNIIIPNTNIMTITTDDTADTKDDTTDIKDDITDTKDDATGSGE